MHRRPNILFLFTDDQRFDTIAALGNDQIHTPNLDKLVRRGTIFTRAHIMGGTCPAVCMPSRAMLHSGRTLFHLQDCGREIPQDHTTLGETLGKQGYDTYGIGKWHNGTAAFNRSFAGGAEIYFGGMADHWNMPANDYDPNGQYATRLPRCKDPSSSNKVMSLQCDHVTPGKHSTDLCADAAINYLDNRSGDDPFFLYVSFLAPHDPRTMPQRYLDMYNPDDIELPPNYLPGHPFDNGELWIRDEKLEAWPRTEDAIRRHIAEYYGMITHLDDAIGRILETLERTGQADNTIIVFAGDNGLAVGRHGLMGKQNLYDHSVRVPLIFAGPGIGENRQSESFCYLLDIFPTLCDLVGAETPPSVEGCSLLPAMQDPTIRVRDTLHLAYRDVQRGVRDERYKLIAYFVEGKRRFQIFDLQEDPWELNDLIDDPKHAEHVKRLAKELTRLRDELDDHTTGDGEFWDAFDAP